MTDAKKTAKSKTWLALAAIDNIILFCITVKQIPPNSSRNLWPWELEDVVEHESNAFEASRILSNATTNATTKSTSKSTKDEAYNMGPHRIDPETVVCAILKWIQFYSQAVVRSVHNFTMRLLLIPHTHSQSPLSPRSVQGKRRTAWVIFIHRGQHGHHSRGHHTMSLLQSSCCTRGPLPAPQHTHCNTNSWRTTVTCPARCYTHPRSAASADST